MGCLVVVGLVAVVALCWASLSAWAVAAILIIAFVFVPVVD